MKVSILTLGCKVNQAESSFIEGNLVNSGCSIVPLTGRPDYCVINTCSVTAKSDYQSRQLIRRAIRAGAKVIVTGCYSQLRADEIAGIEGDIHIVDNKDKHNIIQMLADNSAEIRSCLSFKSRAYMKIQDGCNNACTYCIIPKARGGSRSVEAPEILKQALEFESQGYNEIVLTGIHLGLYGNDLKPKSKLSYILKTLLDKTQIRRIRISSLETNELEMDDGLIDLLKAERICRHLHIPLQSGDDSVLRRMNRMYTTRDYFRVVESVLSKVPDVAIGTDVIVGFPAESEKEFGNTRDLLESLPLSYMHIFPFSPRQGTVASAMGDQIAFSVKKERYNELNTLNQKKRTDYATSQLGKILDVIVEECDFENRTVTGTSGNYLKITAHPARYPKKSLVYVRVTASEGNLLKGIPISAS